MAVSKFSDLNEKRRRLKEKILKEEYDLMIELDQHIKKINDPEVEFAKKVKLAEEIKCRNQKQNKQLVMKLNELSQRSNSEHYKKKQLLLAKEHFIKALNQQINDNKECYNRKTKYTQH